MDIPVIRGVLPHPSERASAERAVYESGEADANATAFGTDILSAWRHLRETYEPSAGPALETILADPELAPLVRGTIADLAAGSCWLAGRVGALPRVEQVYAVDLSERFLREVGAMVYGGEGGDLSKLTFVASDFTHIPLPDHSLDTAFLFAALHHSLAPIAMLREVWRCLKPNGVLFIHESPVGTWRLEQKRRWSITVTKASEIPITANDIGYYATMAGFSAAGYRRLTSPRDWLRGLVRAALYLTRLEDRLRPAPGVWAFRREAAGGS